MAMAGMEIVRRIAAVIAVAFGIALTGFCATVENVRGSQRPNSNLVDIYYDLNTVDGWSCTVEVAIEGRTNEVTATTFSGDVGTGIVPGKNHHIVWESGVDWRGNKGDVKAVVTATIEARTGKPKKVRLWEGGPYWADRNIGADNPWDYGLYFWWGDTTGCRPAGSTLSFSFERSNCPTDGKQRDQLRNQGWTSNDILALSHDAAHVKWGGSWRMPTTQEFLDLNNNCDWIWTTINGVNGYVVRGRGVYTSNSIFLPCAGYGNGGTSLCYAGGLGYYWSSVPDLGGYFASALYFENYHHVHDTRNGFRYMGQSIRPVQGFAN